MAERSFFLQPDFLRFQGDYRWLEYEGIRMPVFGNGEWVSPLKAPFGAFELPDSTGYGAFVSFINHCIEQARREGIPSMEIQPAPDWYYRDKQVWIRQALLAAGFRELHADISYYLEIEGSFREKINFSERWKLGKAGRLGFIFRENSSPDWQAFHAFVLASRLRKGYVLSMTAAELETSSSRFPGIYRVREVVSPDGELAACALTVKVSDDTEYIFYTADRPDFRAISPVVMLHAGIYEAARAEGRRYLDLGTASLEGKVNKGIADFKRNLGGIMSRRSRFRLDVS